MRPGRVVALSLLVAAAAAPAAVAEPTPKPGPAACRPALRDPAGDTVFGPAGSSFAALDIVVGAVGRSKTELVAVLGLAGDVAPDAATARLGYRWELVATVRGTQHRFAFAVAPTGEPTAEFTVNGTARPVSATVKDRTITWRVQRADLPALSKPDRPSPGGLVAMTSVAGVTVDEAGDGRIPGRCKR